MYAKTKKKKLQPKNCSKKKNYETKIKENEVE